MFLAPTSTPVLPKEVNVAQLSTDAFVAQTVDDAVWMLKLRLDCEGLSYPSLGKTYMNMMSFLSKQEGKHKQSKMKISKVQYLFRNRSLQLL